jgi:hypothetical protein
MEQAIVIEKAVGKSSASVTPPILPLEEVAKPKDPVIPGEREWIRGPLGNTASYRLIVSGEVGPKEIGKLIKVLTAQKAVFSDDDDGEETEH